MKKIFMDLWKLNVHSTIIMLSIKVVVIDKKKISFAEYLPEIQLDLRILMNNLKRTNVLKNSTIHQNNV